MKKSQLIIAATLAALWGGSAVAVTADEAKALGTTLTPTGAEKGANKDGSIPAYSGGEKPPASYKGSGPLTDPYAGEKPKFSITQANSAQYADMLTAGARELLKKYPDFRMDVYPTHRSVSFPQAVIDATAKNAVNAKTKDGGVGVEGAWGGVPFPIPKNGIEVMWNHQLRYQGAAIQTKAEAYNIDAAGNVVQSNGANNWNDFPYYGMATKEEADGAYYRFRNITYAPSRRNGEKLLIVDNVNPLDKGRRAYQYLPGQRRVKLAPDLAYDTPQPGTAGATTYDDTFGYNGAMDRYDFKLIGKKEMIVPYNMYKWIYEADIPKLAGKKFHNADAFRWETHRVWVVEATLKPGSRHIYAKRTFFVDEDSWAVVAADAYDARGQLFRSTFMAPVWLYDSKTSFAQSAVHYDFVAGIYSVAAHPGPGGGPKVQAKLFPEKDWAPEAMAGAGIR